MNHGHESLAEKIGCRSCQQGQQQRRAVQDADVARLRASAERGIRNFWLALLLVVGVFPAVILVLLYLGSR